MAKFDVKIQREVQVEIEAVCLEDAERLANKIVSELEPAKLLSIHVEGYVEPVEPEAPTPPFRGKPNGGGSPGTPVVKTEVLVDQVAKVA